MRSAIRVLVVGKYTLEQKQMLKSLDMHQEVQFVGFVSTGEEAINFHTELKPDIILMDVILDKITGLETARWIKEQDSRVKIILFSTLISIDFLLTGLQLGLDGYLSKDTNSTILKDAILRIYHGGRYYHSAVMEILPVFYQ